MVLAALAMAQVWLLQSRSEQLQSRPIKQLGKKYVDVWLRRLAKQVPKKYDDAVVLHVSGVRVQPISQKQAGSALKMK